MAASYAFGPSEDDIIIKDRLFTHATTGKGEPPLKKLHKKFTFFLQELATFEIPLLRSKAIVEANVRQKENLAELKDEISTQILQVHADIEGLKKQLEESKNERSRKKYCEAIQKFISLYPTRSEKHKLLTDLDKEFASLDTDNTASYALLELRKKQFTLLLRAVVELQNTIEEEKKGLIEDIRATIEKHKNGWGMQGEALKLGLLISNRFSFQSSCSWITWFFILVCLFCGYWKGFWNRM